MSRYLYILRHAKSDWGHDGLPDKLRPLSKRGLQDAPNMGLWLKQNLPLPDCVLCSTGLRAKQTLEGVRAQWPPSEVSVQYLDQLYLAGLATLLSLLSQVPAECQRVMLVAHNPGMDELVMHLACTQPALSASGKLMSTAALACFHLPDDWSDAGNGGLQGQGELQQIMRPKELP